ncbi:nitroreductase family protein [Micromonospora purpureochromogenes]|uniref:Acg family FMN-binding oxidoreductase n=1 Tax=Micromonospora purpureochromogenes TaxID=47872 RepID=UPI00331774BA
MSTGWWVAPDGSPGPILADCLTKAIAAPSVHNTQPWLFRLHGSTVEVIADRSRQLSLVDPQARELTISVGAAVLNLRVAILAHGRVPLLQLLPAGDPRLLARVTIGPYVPGNETARLLARAIPHRHTNRRPFQDLPVPPEVLDELSAAAGAEHGEMVVVDPTLRDAVFGIARAAENRRRDDPRYWIELGRWTRHTPDRRDGVPPEAFGPWPVLESIPIRDFGLVEPTHRRAVRHFEHEPTVVVLDTGGDGPRDWLQAGQALERTLLTATVRGLATTLMTQPLEIPELRTMLGDPTTGRMPQAIIRVGYGPPSPPTPRRPLNDVLLGPGPASRLQPAVRAG